MRPQTLGLLHFWTQADGLSRAVAIVLLLMSLLSWYFILRKSLQAWRSRRSAAANNFWQADSLQNATQQLSANDPERLFTPLAERCLAMQQQASSGFAAQVNAADLLTRLLRTELDQINARQNSGLTVLASIGSTAPFVGLFGTVWGIYHALLNLAGSQQILLEKIAGPVGEALIMTAAGLAVGVPALLGYNFLSRINRIRFAQIDGFAHDLHAYCSGNQA